MKLLMILIGTTLAAFQGGFEDLFHESQPSSQEATTIKCSHLASQARGECVERYSSRFASGQLDPTAILRQHCTRFENEWDFEATEPPSLCISEFGGWIDS